jgi:hypothetical protein
LGAIYFLFGFVLSVQPSLNARLVNRRSLPEPGRNFWAWLGFSSLFSGPVFGSISGQFGREGRPDDKFFSIPVCGTLAGCFRLPELFLPLSIFLYGFVRLEHTGHLWPYAAAIMAARRTPP